MRIIIDQGDLRAAQRRAARKENIQIMLYMALIVVLSWVILYAVLKGI